MIKRYPNEDGDEIVKCKLSKSNPDASMADIINRDANGVIRGKGFYRGLSVAVDGGQLSNNGSDIETVAIELTNRKELLQDDNVALLDYDGGVTLKIDGVETTKTLTGGSVSFDLTTEKPAGSSINIVAESLADHPAESDSVTIEVVSP
jgi:hypothetical protein